MLIWYCTTTAFKKHLRWLTILSLSTVVCSQLTGVPTLLFLWPSSALEKRLCCSLWQPGCMWLSVSSASTFSWVTQRPKKAKNHCKAPFLSVIFQWKVKTASSHLIALSGSSTRQLFHVFNRPFLSQRMRCKLQILPVDPLLFSSDS